MLLKNKKVAIIGGGPGGLTLARLLQMKGVDVTVYERDINETARVQGATLDLHTDSGLMAIHAAGLLEVFKTAYRPGAEKGRVVDKLGVIVFDEHALQVTKDDQDDNWRPEIDRGALRDILLDALQPGTVIWDSHFVNMTQEGNGWTIHFKNGATATADLVIGADGANSAIRPYLTAVKPYYAGTVILQGNVPDAAATIPAIDALLKGGKVYIYADKKFLHISSKGDGSIDYYISCIKEEHWWKESGIDATNREQLCAWFKKEFTGWDNIWLTLIEHTSLPLLHRPQYCMPLEGGWNTLPNLTLLGDAAHCMPPSGKGVNLAMLDSLDLSEYLTGDEMKDMRTAIAAYEQEMLPRATKEAVDAMEMKDWMHSESAQEQFVQLYCQL